MAKLNSMKPNQFTTHQEHRDWLSKLDFYQDQVLIFQKELTEVSRQHPQLLSIIEHVDEYRAILLKKLEHIDGFRHDIIRHEKMLMEGNQQAWPVKREHEEVRAELNKFIEDFNEFKNTFRRFAAHND